MSTCCCSASEIALVARQCPTDIVTGDQHDLAMQFRPHVRKPSLWAALTHDNVLSCMERPSTACPVMPLPKRAGLTGMGLMRHHCSAPPCKNFIVGHGWP